MAGILSRTALNNLSRLSARPALVAISSRSMGKNFLDPMEHATGLERKELEAIARGNPDPFLLKVQKRGPSTKEQPNLVPSMYDKRIVGCVCHEDTFTISFLWVHKNDPKRCECGAWYKLVEQEDPFKGIPNAHLE